MYVSSFVPTYYVGATVLERAQLTHLLNIGKEEHNLLSLHLGWQSLRFSCACLAPKKLLWLQLRLTARYSSLAEHEALRYALHRAPLRGS